MEFITFLFFLLPSLSERWIQVSSTIYWMPKGYHIYVRYHPSMRNTEYRRPTNWIEYKIEFFTPSSIEWIFFSKLNPFLEARIRRRSRKKCHPMSEHNSVVRFLSKIYDSTKLKIFYSLPSRESEDNSPQFSMTTNKQTNKHERCVLLGNIEDIEYCFSLL